MVFRHSTREVRRKPFQPAVPLTAADDGITIQTSNEENEENSAHTHTNSHRKQTQAFYDFMPCRLVNSFRRFEGLQCHYIQGQAVQEWSLSWTA
jgi:hypothetical protein